MKTKQFICRYNYEGSSYSFEITAESYEEAEKRLKCIGCNGKVDGELILIIPVSSKTTNIYEQIKLYYLNLMQL
jgi:predicted ATP-grasp superfamily ATP-dependent carboligase